MGGRRRRGRSSHVEQGAAAWAPSLQYLLPAILGLSVLLVGAAHREVAAALSALVLAVTLWSCRSQLAAVGVPVWLAWAVATYSLITLVPLPRGVVAVLALAVALAVFSAFAHARTTVGPITMRVSVSLRSRSTTPAVPLMGGGPRSRRAKRPPAHLRTR